MRLGWLPTTATNFWQQWRMLAPTSAARYPCDLSAVSGRWLGGALQLQFRIRGNFICNYFGTNSMIMSGCRGADTSGRVRYIIGVTLSYST
eukprot:379259-Amphidinium_carterae.2